MLNEVMTMLTSGEIDRIAPFLISLTFLSGLILGILFIVKRLAKNLKYSKDTGLSIEIAGSSKDDTTKPDTLVIPDSKYNTPSSIVPGVPPIGAGINIDIQDDLTQLGTNKSDQKLMKLQSDLSDVSWSDFNVVDLSRKIERKSIDTSKLLEKVEKMRQKLIELNHSVEKYKLNNHVYLQMFKQYNYKYKTIYNKLIKTVICKKRPEDIKEEDFIQFYKVNMNEIVMAVCTSILENYKYKFWNSPMELKTDIWKIYGADIENEFENMFRNFKEINKQNAVVLKQYRGELDKRIVASSNALCKKLFKKTFNVESENQIPKINEAYFNKISRFQIFKDQVWEAETYFRIINKAGIEMVAIYERIKANGIDDEMEIAAQVFQLLCLCIEERIKSLLLKEKEEQDKLKQEKANALKEEKLKAIEENKELDDIDKEVNKKIEQLDDLINPTDDTIDKI